MPAPVLGVARAEASPLQLRAPCRRRELVDRLAFFRRRFFRARTDFEADLMEWLGINRGQARLLAALHQARGPLTREALIREADIGAVSFRFYLAAVSEALGPGAVVRLDSAYALTHFGRGECARAVAAVGMGRVRELLGIVP